MALSTPGLGSGLDVNGLVKQLMAVERQPLAALDRQEAGLQAKITAFGSFKGALSALQSSAQALTSAEKFNSAKASAADSGVLTAAAKPGALSGSYDVNVQNLAQSQVLKSSTAFAATSDVVGSGTLTIQFGTYSGASLAAGTNPAALSLTIDSTNNTVAGIKDAINAAKAGVTASVVNDGTGNRLVLTSDNPGEATALKITVDEGEGGTNTNDTGLSRVAFDGATGGVQNMQVATAAKNAKLTINGIEISKSTNTITDALEGVTLTLVKENSSTKVTVARDTGSIKGAIEGFVKAVNDVNSAIKELASVDPNSKRGGPLVGDSTVRGVQAQLRKLLSTPIDNADGLTALSQIGITFQKDGKLAVDSSKLQAAVEDRKLDLSKLFGTTNGVAGFAARVGDAMTSALGSDGLIADRTEGLAESVKLVGKRREALGARLVAIEARYRAQFNALDASVASMTKTSNYLQQQLANLPKVEGAR